MPATATDARPHLPDHQTATAREAALYYAAEAVSAAATAEARRADHGTDEQYAWLLNRAGTCFATAYVLRALDQGADPDEATRGMLDCLDDGGLVDELPRMWLHEAGHDLDALTQAATARA